MWNAFKSRIAWAADVMLYCAVIIGVVVAIGGLCVGFLWLRHSGLLAKAVPPAPVLSPVKVRIHGPTMIIRGGQYMFTADVTGPAGTPEWSMLPQGSGALHVSADGRSAEFSTLDGGDVALMVSVAGDGKQISHDHIQVEIVNLQEKQPETAQPVAMATPAPPTLQEMTLAALDAVDSDDRSAEGRFVAGSIRSLMNRLQTGLLPRDADLVGELGQQINAAMPDRAGKWASFIAALDTILEQEELAGNVTAASKTPALGEIADVLQRAQ